MIREKERLKGQMESVHLLNLRVLADADVGDYGLFRFEGREAISECFDYHIELITSVEPGDLSGWIGKLAEFDLTMSDGGTRVFAGRIYETHVNISGDLNKVRVRIRPAFHATAYGRATHCIQDKSSKDIFEAMTADVPGLTTSIKLSPAPPVRGYSTRYDETEFDFLSRLLAQDGIMYFFTYDRSAGPYRHKMIVSTATSDYVDIDGGDSVVVGARTAGTVKSLARTHRAAARAQKHHAFDVNKLDTPWEKAVTASQSWGKVYTHEYETTGAEAVLAADNDARSTLHGDAIAQAADSVMGSGDSPMFCAGGRIKLSEASGITADRLVLTSVTHSAHDPWMLPGGGPAEYSNSFTAMDASLVCRPPPPPLLRAPGPLLAKVALKGATEGEAKIDDKSRIPVEFAEARVYAGAKPLSEHVWVPVQQQWAHSTHGAQFFPRIGTRVIIDFLYGNPDLPFVSGTVYTPSQKYPFDPASKATQSGWRSVSDKNGSISQEFHFEDKPGAEEIYLYTGRDYRRLIDNDDFGTIKHDQTLIVENDQTETIKHDQKLNVENDRTVKVTGVEKIDVTKTQTVTVTDKVMYESKKEIEIKVGSSTITMTPSGIVIKAVKIEIKGDATVDVKAGAAASVKGPKVDVIADAMLTLKGGIVMIN